MVDQNLDPESHDALLTHNRNPQRPKVWVLERLKVTGDFGGWEGFQRMGGISADGEGF